ncbi:hypothetical protein M885DRAFT_546377 [Pelagophyceae sp. CCMP2097]|nr:hypothetical protein M885DRAFT_546377 [Pelagophyceae sp. CCMP2097]
MRTGVLLEDMDALAGSVAWRHVADADAETPTPLIVTASVDAIEVRRELCLGSDYVLRGDMVWAGKSSLEIHVSLRARGSDDAALSGVFTFVARGPDGRAAAVPPLRAETAAEVAAYGAAAAKQGALKAARAAASAAPVDAAKLAKLEALLAHARIACDFPGLADDGVITMAQTGLRHASLCHPQERNTAGRVFGGVLMRRALELAYATAYAFGGAAPHLVALDRVEFVRPVDVGALLALKSVVALSERGGETAPGEAAGGAATGGGGFAGVVHVNVSAAAWRPAQRSSEQTNTFAFVFALQGAHRALKLVQPANKAEARLQLKAAPRLKPPPSASAAGDD